MASEEHDKPVDSDPQTSGRRETVFEGKQIVVIYRVCLVVARCARRGLRFEASTLIQGIVQL